MPYRTPKRSELPDYNPAVSFQSDSTFPQMRARSKSAPHLHRRAPPPSDLPLPDSHLSRRRRRVHRFSRRDKPLPYVDVRVVDFIKVPDRLGEPRDAPCPLDDLPRPPAYNLASPRRVLDNEHIFDVDALESTLAQAKSDNNNQEGTDECDLGARNSEYFMIGDNGHSDRIFRIVTNVNRNSGEDGVQNFGAQHVDDDADGESAIDDDFDPDFDFNPAEARTPPSTLLRATCEVQRHRPPQVTKNEDLPNDNPVVIVSLIDEIEESDSIVSSLIETVSLVDSTDILNRSLTPTDRACRSITSIPSAGVPSSMSSGNSDSPPARLMATNATNGPTGTHVTITQRRYAPDFLNMNVPSPVKYTFKPILSAEDVSETVSAKPESRCETVSPALIKPVSFGRHESVLSNVSASQSTSHPTLKSVRSVVESIDPRSVLSMAGTPGMAVAAAVGMFRRSSAKRESDESTNTDSTEYYEDDYTKFIEKKRISQIRLRNYPRMIFSESRGNRHHHSRMECRSNSPVSLATSDEEYSPVPVLKT